MKHRLFFAVLLAVLTVVPAALLGWAVRGMAEEPAKSNTVRTISEDAALADASETPEQAAADKREEQEFFEMYKALADTVDQVDRNYVKKVDRRELMEAAIKGVLSKLDPYSSYIGPEEATQFRDTVESQFGGIGIQIVEDEGQIKVLSPLVGSPAYKAGVLAGDRILKIDDSSTTGMTLDDAVHKLKGDAGTSVALTVAHAADGNEETVRLVREMIHVGTVLGDRRKSDDSWDFMLEGDRRIGYIRITTFSRDTAGDLKKAMLDLKARDLRGLIVNLRFNPGELLTAAVNTCDMFLDGGRIVSTEGRNSPERVWDATKKTDAFAGFPMVILVNHYSASASEIVSACLQDHGRAIIIGDRTWGKGSVQNVIELEDGKSLLKLTTASYKRPNGHNIHRFPDSKESDEWGVMPNPGFAVKLNDDEMADLLVNRQTRDVLMPQKRASTAVDAIASSKQEHSPGEQSAAGKAAALSHSHVRSHDQSPGSETIIGTANGSHFVDRQLQKALDYLSTQLAKAS